MTTDPRIVECAKALYRAFMEDGVKRYGFTDDTGGDLTRASKDTQEAYPAAVTACVLKWLEQEPSAKAYDIAFLIEQENYAMHHPQEDACAGRVYTAMCEQAAKEITDG